MMTFEQHLAQVEAVADWDAYVAAMEEEARWEREVDLATERYYEGDGRMDRCAWENERDLREFDAMFPNGYVEA